VLTPVVSQRPTGGNLPAGTWSYTYLPAPYEWNVIDPYRAAIGGFAADDTSYWTSSELDNDDWEGGIYHRMGGTFNGYTGQGIWACVRCMRRD
jgi:hypothetical protein